MAALEPGAWLGDYRIERLVDTGGMGEVYLAVDERLDRRVAVKILPPALASDPAFRDRFDRESRLAASLEHPNVLPVYARGETDGISWIAMRYIDGPTLATLIHHERLGAVAALAILGQIADALDVAHTRGLVHRDVKPGNILVEPGSNGGPGRAYLADFGLARGPGSDRTPGQRMGTVHYVAPELIEDGAPDPRSDVYSLGCVLFECLTGQVPFPSTDARTELMAHLVEQPPAASSIVGSLPRAVDDVLRKAMAKDPPERFATCRATVDAAAAAMAVTDRLPGRPDVAPTNVLPAVVPAAVAEAVKGRGTDVLATKGDETPSPSPVAADGLERGRRRSRRLMWIVVLAVLLGAGTIGLVSLVRAGDRVEPSTSPSESAAQTPTTSRSGSVSPSTDSPSPTTSGFPSDAEQRILSAVPSDVHDCESSEDGPDTALARITCTSGSVRTQYNLMPTAEDAEAALAELVNKGGVPEGTCETESLAVGPWVPEDAPDETAGRLLCYQAEGESGFESWIVWTWTSAPDPTFVLYAWAVRSGDHPEQLYGWWTKHATLEI